MKTLQYTGSFDEAILIQQLIAAFPAWRVITPGGIVEHVGSYYNELTGVLTLWVPDNTDEQLVQQVIDAHDPSAVPWTPATWQDIVNFRRNFLALPNWATWTTDEASIYIHDQILNGFTVEELATWVNTNVTDLASAKTALTTVGQELIELREITSNMAKAIIILRDLVVRRTL